MTNKLPEEGKKYQSITENEYCITVTSILENLGIVYYVYEHEDHEYSCSITLKHFFNVFEELPDQEPTIPKEILDKQEELGYKPVETATELKQREDIVWKSILSNACKKCGKTFEDSSVEPYCQRWDCDQLIDKGVQEALEEVKRELKEWEDDCFLSSGNSQKPLDREAVISTFRYVQDLVNAIEKNKKEIEKILEDVKEPRFNILRTEYDKFLVGWNKQKTPVSSIVEHAREAALNWNTEPEHCSALSELKEFMARIGDGEIYDGDIFWNKVQNLINALEENRQDSLEKRIEKLEQLIKGSDD